MAESVGRVVLVSGASKGLGLAMALEFGLNACKVIISSHDETSLTWAREQLAQWGVSVRAELCDVRSREQVEAMIGRVVAEHGRLDVLVNNAGVIVVGPIETMTIEDFEEAMSTMFWGHVYSSLAAVPVMKKQGAGRIVNITSIGGIVSVPHLLPYSAAKAAAVAFSEGLSSELRGSAVSVLTVVPGLMRTGSYLNARFKGDRKKEYAWFSVLSSTPVPSISADAAAKRIVRASFTNQPELILSVPANLATRIHGLMPGTLVKLLSLQKRILPSTDSGTMPAVPGRELEKDLHSGMLDRVRYLGRKAAARLQPR